MKMQTQTTASSSRTSCRLRWLLLIPLLALTLPAQATGPKLNIESSTNGTILLSWQVMTNGYIVLSATNVAGPWEPCRNHVTEAAGVCHMSITASHQCGYLRLVEGYYDEFEDPNLEGWTIAFADPQATNYVNWECTNGQLRVYGHWPGNGLQRNVIFYQTNLTLADFVMSIDILGWDDGLPGDRSIVSLFGRLDPATLNFPDVYACGGTVSMRHDVNPYLSALSLWKSTPHGVGWTDKPILKTDPAKDYRLLFDGVGGQFHVAVEEIPSGGLQHHYGSDAAPLPEGWVGFYVNVGGTNGVFNFTVDNFVIYALP